jgi:hypothetical protein
MTDTNLIPIRIQLKGTKGFDLQKESKKINGLPCVKCYGGKWGNPFKTKKDYDDGFNLVCDIECIANTVGYNEGYHIAQGFIVLEKYDNKKESILKSIELFEKLIQENDKKIKENKSIIIDTVDYHIKSLTGYDYSTASVSFSSEDWKNKL